MSTAGLGVDSAGNPVIDPSENVKALSDASHKRQDDLRSLERELFDAKIAHIRDINDLRAQHQRELSQVGREEIIKAASATASIAEVLRAQVASTAKAAEDRLYSYMTDTNKRLSALELAASQATGKSAGVNWVGVFVAGAVSLVGGLLGIAGVLYAVLSK